MLKFFKIFFCATIIFSASICSAATVEMSEDDISNFLLKCNQELKKNSPEDNLDAPSLKETFRRYEDDFQLDENISVKCTYTTKDDKIYSIRMEANKIDDNVKTFFEGMNIIFLKSLGLSDEDARELAKISDSNGGRNEKFIETLNKKFIVQFKHSAVTIIASNSKK